MVQVAGRRQRVRCRRLFLDVNQSYLFSLALAALLRIHGSPADICIIGEIVTPVRICPLLGLADSGRRWARIAVTQMTRVDIDRAAALFVTGTR